MQCIRRAAAQPSKRSCSCASFMLQLSVELQEGFAVYALHYYLCYRSWSDMQT
jgi:hypothetical protein